MLFLFVHFFILSFPYHGVDLLPPCWKKHPPKERSTHTMGLEKYGGQRATYIANKKKILATESICAICGLPVDKTLKFPHPLSASVDHKIPWALGGDCSMDNLQLSHLKCNRMKSDKLVMNPKAKEEVRSIGNNDLPLSADWLTY